MEDWFTFLMVNNNKDRQYHNAYEKIDFLSIGKRFNSTNSPKGKVREASIRTLLDKYTRKLPQKKAVVTQVNQSQKQLGKIFKRSAATVNMRLKRAEENQILIQERKKLVRLYYSPIRPTREYMDELGEKHKGYVYHCDKAVWLKKSSSYSANKQIEFEPSNTDETKFKDIKSGMKCSIIKQYLKWYKSNLTFDDSGMIDGLRPFRKQTDFVIKKVHVRYTKPVEEREMKKAAERISNYMMAMDKKVLIQDNLTF